MITQQAIMAMTALKETPADPVTMLSALHCFRVGRCPSGQLENTIVNWNPHTETPMQPRATVKRAMVISKLSISFCVDNNSLPAE